MQTQLLLFQTIKQKLPDSAAFANVIGDVLNVSSDSVYRRLRGEKVLTLPETELLCKHFNISLDTLWGNTTNNIIFRQALANPEALDSFCEKLNFAVDFLENIVTTVGSELLYSSPDIPFYHYAQFPELILFRTYVWQQGVNRENTILFEEFLKEQFNSENLAFFSRISEASRKISMTEIWNPNTLMPLLNQLDYFHELSRFAKEETFINLCNQALELIEYIRKCTEAKRQIHCGKKSPFNLYLSSLDFSNDVILVKRENKTVSSSYVLNLITIINSENVALCEENAKWLDNLQSKSLYMNGAQEKDRIKFFSKLKEKVLKLYN
ncbi:MAG: hypothetical protein LBG15_13220 [Dysgonamonadaceae bacterium]|jgi:hypothetical protein|nr:hypothetical protein [Dysgonamonadaceae bacterium]